MELEFETNEKTAKDVLDLVDYVIKNWYNK